jgi:hypothetical protein
MIKVWTDLNTGLFSSSFRLTEPKITKKTKVSAHYYVGCRLGQILHTRLRMNCSALNAHLFIKNIVSKLRVGSGKSFHAFTVEGRKYSE